MNEKAPLWSRRPSLRGVAAASAVVLTASIAGNMLLEKDSPHNSQQGQYVRTLEGWARCIRTLVVQVDQKPRTFEFTIQAERFGNATIKAADVDFWNNAEPKINVPMSASDLNTEPRLRVEHTFKGADGEYIAQGQVTTEDGSVLTCPAVTISVGGTATTPGGTPPPLPATPFASLPPLPLG